MNLAILCFLINNILPNNTKCYSNQMFIKLSLHETTQENLMGLISYILYVTGLINSISTSTVAIDLMPMLHIHYLNHSTQLFNQS